MKRTGSLWPQLTSWENLLTSALAAARGKRKCLDVARFLFDLEPNAAALQRELLVGTWQPGGYRTFWIRDPKPRMISAAPFRDRVVHHAITRVLDTVFDGFLGRAARDFSFPSQQGPRSYRIRARSRSRSTPSSSLTALAKAHRTTTANRSGKVYSPIHGTDAYPLSLRQCAVFLFGQMPGLDF